MTEPIPGARPGDAVHHRLRHQLLLPRRRPGLLLGMSDPRRDARLQAGPVRRLAAAPRRCHRAPGPALAEVGIASGWAGLYEMTPDHNALIGEADEVNRFLYATGFSGHGFLMGPAVGEVVRDLYLGSGPSSTSADSTPAGSPTAGSGPSSTSSEPTTTKEPLDDHAQHPPERRRAAAPGATAAARCGVELGPCAGDRATTSPVNGEHAQLRWRGPTPPPSTTPSSVRRQAFRAWRKVPAPARGAARQAVGELLAEHKDDLATLVSLEVGKITSEARGEVQEMIDICDFAVGLSRQLYGRTMPSERPGHRLMETWHPLGVVGRDQRVQLPGRGLVVEHRGRAGLRRPRGLEAVGAGAADRRWPARGPARPGARRARRAGRRLSRSLLGGARRRARPWSTTPASRCSAPPARPGWAARWGRGSPAGSAARCSSSAATTPPSSAPSRRPRPDHARHRVLGRRDGRPAVHDDAPRHRPPQRGRRARRAARRRPTRGCRSATRWPTAPWSAR